MQVLFLVTIFIILKIIYLQDKAEETNRELSFIDFIEKQYEKIQSTSTKMGNRQQVA